MSQLKKTHTKRIVLVVGLASGLASGGLAIYAFLHPVNETILIILQGSAFLTLASVISNQVHSQFKKVQQE